MAGIIGLPVVGFIGPYSKPVSGFIFPFPPMSMGSPVLVSSIMISPVTGSTVQERLMEIFSAKQKID